MARQSSHLNFDLELHSVREGPVWLIFSVERFLIDKKYILRGGGMTPIIMEQEMMLENWNLTAKAREQSLPGQLNKS